MAEKLKTFDFSASSAITEATEKAVYPWEEWLDGDIWQITEGDDFDTHPLMMERIIRTRATARGAKVRLRHQPKEFNGKRGKRNPFGIIVMQRTDIVGANEVADTAKAAAAAKAQRSAARAEKKIAAEKAAAKTLADAGIKPTKKAAPKATKSVARKPAPVKKTVSKRPAKVGV